MEEFQNLAQLKAAMKMAGASRLYLKVLAPNDNFKNQIYLAGSFAVLNLLPASKPIVQDNGTTMWATMKFSWLQTDGQRIEAPQTKLILYPQYPEVRLSGFLAGCKSNRGYLFDPGKLGRTPGRVLFLGIANSGEILGSVVAAETKLAEEVQELKLELPMTTLVQIPMSEALDERQLLISELTRIHGLGWIGSKSLGANGLIRPCTSSNCIGFTLEAELGVARNGRPEPDFMGWEIKASLVNKLDRPATAKPQTLFTPEPTMGLYRDEGVEAFIRKYGYEDRMGREDRLNFGGKFVYGIPAKLTGLTLSIDGYNSTSQRIENAQGGIVLHDSHGNVAAGWGFDTLLNRWSKKHDRAAYVSGIKHSDEWQYKYGSEVRLAVGTDFSLFLKAVQNGLVFYDPGIKIENASTSQRRIKRRSQFRIASNKLAELYHSVEMLKLETV